MLVNGQILMGTMKQSYANTVGFVVSAQRYNCTALQDITPPHLLCKINQLNSVITSNLCYFLTTKSNQKLLGCSPSGQTTQWHEAATNLRATIARDSGRIKQISASHLAVCLFRLSRNPKPYEIKSWVAGRRLL